jgi:hypothetical protein
MNVEVQLKESSQSIVHENVVNAYTKGDMYCVFVAGKDGSRSTRPSTSSVYKYPLANVWRVKESYN